MGWLSNLFNMIGGAGRSLGGFMGNAGRGAMGMSGKTGGQGGMFGQFNPASMGAGLGIMALGHLMNHPVGMPDFGSMPQVQSLQNFTANPPALPQGMQDEINKSLMLGEQVQRRNLDMVYQNLRPGTDFSTDSRYQQDKALLERNLTSNRANALMGPTLQYQEPLRQGMTNLAELGVGQGMGQAALNAERMKQRNQMMGNIGSMFLMRGLGMPYYMNMFGQGNNSGSIY